MNDVPFCDVCEKREATSVSGGIYRCEYCEEAHERLAARDPRDADPELDQDRDHADQVVSGYDEAA